MSNVSRVGVIATRTLPHPLPYQKYWYQWVVCNFKISYQRCGSSVKMYTLVLKTPHFCWCGACHSVLLPVQ